MKKFFMISALMVTVFLTSLGAFAEQQIGFVDMTKILNGYSKAQQASSKVKAQQEELQKMITDARTQVQTASDTEKSALEKKLTEEINQKNNVFRADYEKQVKEIQDNITGIVKQVANDKKIDTIFKKENIVTGGKDLTDEVLARLNK